MRWWGIIGIIGGIRLFAIQKSEGLLQAIKLIPLTTACAFVETTDFALSARLILVSCICSVSACERIAKNPEAGAALLKVEIFLHRALECCQIVPF